MRFLLVNYEYPPIGGGAATATEKIAQSLVRHGHGVVVLTTAYEDHGGTAEEDGVTVVRLPALRRLADRSNVIEMACFVALALGALPAVMRKHQPEACVAFFSIPGGPVAWWANRRFNLPYVVSLRGGDVPGAEGGIAWIHKLLAPFRRRLLRDAVAVVANSAGLKTLSEKADPVAVQVIPNGIDSDVFRPSTLPRNAHQPVRFLFVGRLNEQKNVALLLNAFAAVRATGAECRLSIVGDGPLRDPLRKLAGELGIDDFVDWLGWQPRASMPAHYGAADCLINPSRYEGMPNVLLEAMACGLPIIASDVPGNRDVIKGSDFGRLFQDNDRKALVEALRVAVCHRDWLADAGTKAREVVSRNYAWDATAKAYLSIFRPIGNGFPHEAV